MNKLNIYFILGIFLISNVCAEAFEITDIKVYVGESRERDADIDGGDFEAYREDVIEYRIEMDNNHDVDIDNIDLFLVVNGLKKNGDDIESSLDNQVIKEGKDKTFTLEVIVPSDSIYDYYDIELEVTGEFENNTNLDEFFQSWELEVMKIEEDEESKEKEKSEIHYAVTNLSDACNKLITTDKEHFKQLFERLDKPYDTTTKDDRITTLESQNTECYSDLNKQKNEVTRLNTQVNGMKTNTECNKLVTSAKKKTNDTIALMVFIVGGLGMLAWGKWKQKIKSTEGEIARYN